MKKEIEGFNKAMKQAEKRVTPQRLAIFKKLISTDAHPTAQEIYHHVKQEHPMITLATVYHTLDMLIQIGMAKELGFFGLSTRFEANMKPHINLICLKCGKIEDLNDPNSLGVLKAVINNNLEFKISDQRVEFSGYCKQCQQDG